MVLLVVNFMRSYSHKKQLFLLAVAVIFAELD